MRPRSTGISEDAPPQTLSQNFRPKSEWKQEEAASSLSVYLPGFVLDQITVTPDYSNRTVKIVGQCRLPNDRLLLVNEAFSIPEDCDLAKMNKQSGRGVLVLRMPRNIVPPQEYDRLTETSTAGFQKQNDDANEVANKPEKPTENLEQNISGFKEEKSKQQNKESTTPSVTAAGKVEENEEKSETATAKAEGKTSQNSADVSAKKGMVKEMNEDRKLIVNIGVAVLIIVGLGVSLFYKLRIS